MLDRITDMLKSSALRRSMQHYNVMTHGKKTLKVFPKVLYFVIKFNNDKITLF